MRIGQIEGWTDRWRDDCNCFYLVMVFDILGFRRNTSKRA